MARCPEQTWRLAPPARLRESPGAARSRVGRALLLAGVVAAIHASALVAQAPLELWAAVSVRALVEEVASDARAESGVEVAVRADATSRIVPQISSGAPADILVAADRAWMLEAVARGLVQPEAARLVALNRIALLAASGSGPAGTETLTAADLTRLLGSAAGRYHLHTDQQPPEGRRDRLYPR